MNPRTHQPKKTSSLPNIIITITTTITTARIADMGRWWSCPDIAVTIITTTTTATTAIEVASSGMTVKQDLRVLFFCVLRGLEWG
jgi:hypothetical protein